MAMFDNALFNTFGINEISACRENSLSLKIYVIDNKELFEQHFPTYPMLPGAFSVALAKECFDHFVGKNILKISDHVKKMERISFLQRIRPYDQLDLNYKWVFQNGDCNVVFMIYNQEAKICLRGIFVYALNEGSND